MSPAERTLFLGIWIVLVSCSGASPARRDVREDSLAMPEARALDGGLASKTDARWAPEFMAEWLDKQRAGVPGHDDRLLHFIYDEWFRGGHIRVSLRGDGHYAFEVDGMSGWNGFVSRSPGGHSLRKSGGFVHGKGIFPFLNYLVRPTFNPPGSMVRYEAFSYPPCSEPPKRAPRVDDFRASMTLVAEFSSLAVFHSDWRSPYCAGFPHRLAKESWRLVERVTKKAVVSPEWHKAFPDEPEDVNWEPSRGPD